MGGDRVFTDLTRPGGSSHQSTVRPLKAETLRLGAPNKGHNKTGLTPTPWVPPPLQSEKGTTTPIATSSTQTSLSSGLAQVPR